MNADNEAYPDSLDMSELELIDQICDRYEASWKAGKRPRIEDFLSSVPEERRSVLLCGLVELELDYRRKHGETPTQQEYESRFPGSVETLRQAFAKHGQSKVDQSLESTHDRVETSLAETQDAPAEAVPRKRVLSGHPKHIGRYRIVEVLGQGAFGTVYRAHDDELARDVAIKVWRADRFATDEAAESLLSEARAVARLDKHPSIVGIHDVGR